MVFHQRGLLSDSFSSVFFLRQIVFHRRGGGGVGVLHRRGVRSFMWRGGGGSFERMVFHENGFSSG